MHTPTPARPPSGGVWPQKLKSKGQPTSGQADEATSPQAHKPTSHKQKSPQAHKPQAEKPTSNKQKNKRVGPAHKLFSGLRRYVTLTRNQKLPGPWAMIRQSGNTVRGSQVQEPWNLDKVLADHGSRIFLR